VSARSRLGSHLARARRSAYFRLTGFRRRRGDYLFACGPGGDARRYRCDHQAEQLRLAGASAHVGYHAELDLERMVDRYRTFVLYRVPWDDKVEALLALARGRGASVVADVDDLVFDVEHAHEIAGLEALAPSEKDCYLASIERLGRTLRAVDGVVVSTEPLGNAARQLNDRVCVAANAVSVGMVAAAAKARRPGRANPDVTIAYLSGTPTHDRDFLEAADGVLWALEHLRYARLLVVGYLRLDDRFARFGPRVTKMSAVPWRRLPSVLAGVDVNLAPLEAGNQFTEAKSCLKYLEAALMGVPTIASPRADFQRVIDDGRNGVLAEGEAGWRNALRMLVESSASRTALGAAAHADAISNHTTAARWRSTAEAFATLSTDVASEGPPADEKR
jgi:glycosyltransferase involved in cell wall biosynthesis